MARARNIKPGFFSSEQVVSVSYEWRLLFLGLLMLADSNEIVSDDPARIKSETFPFDDIDVDSGIEELQKAGLVVRGNGAIQIINHGHLCEIRAAQDSSYAAKRRANRRFACPKWADKMAIKAIYREAKKRSMAGERVHVDHVIPLAGKMVSGLHVASNLEIIPAEQNQKKSNKYSGEM